jgi:hypothetical protein
MKITLADKVELRNVAPPTESANAEIHYYGVVEISAPPAVLASGKQSRAKRTFKFIDKNGDILTVVAFASDARSLKIRDTKG